MLILALDSTAQVASAALCENDAVLAARTIESGRTHSEVLLPLIEELYKKAGRSIGDTGLYACSAGPGSFTGVRIGAATIKGLAFGGKPCVGISTLAALAYNLRGQEGLVVPVMDARRGQVYNALFSSEEGRLTRLTPDRILMLDQLEAELAGYDKPIFFCGDGYSLARQAIALLGVQDTPEERIAQDARSVAALAFAAYRQGSFVSDSELRPFYLRAPQAEREREERLRREAAEG